MLMLALVACASDTVPTIGSCQIDDYKLSFTLDDPSADYALDYFVQGADNDHVDQWDTWHTMTSSQVSAGGAASWTVSDDTWTAATGLIPTDEGYSTQVHLFDGNTPPATWLVVDDCRIVPAT